MQLLEQKRKNADFCAKSRFFVRQNLSFSLPFLAEFCGFLAKMTAFALPTRHRFPLPQRFFRYQAPCI
jgi:hypothetical protein